MALGKIILGTFGLLLTVGVAAAVIQTAAPVVEAVTKPDSQVRVYDLSRHQRVKTYRAGSTIKLHGKHLDGVQGVLIGGVATDIESKREDSVTVKIPDKLGTGMHDIIVHTWLRSISLKHLMSVDQNLVFSSK